MGTNQMFSKIAEFTCAVMGAGAPTKARPLTQDECKFAARMVIDEVMELLVTQMSQDDAIEFITRAAEERADIHYGEMDEVQMCAQQADALVDICHYSGDVAARSGLKLDIVMDAVIASNMAKIANGVLRSKEGKILKPAGWQAPDVESLIRKQM